MNENHGTAHRSSSEGRGVIRGSLSASDATRTPSHRGRQLTLGLILGALALLALAPTALAQSRNYTSSFATFTANNGQNPASVAVDEDTGDVYAVDIDDNTVRRFDSSGAPENFTCTPGPNCADGATNTLTGFAFDPSPGSTQVAIDRSGGPADGTIYVSDGSNALVKVFDVDGTLLGTLDGSGTPNGAFGQPTGVAVDQANGDLFIAGASGARTIWRYSPSAALATEADFTDSIAYSGGIFVNPGHIAVASGNLYAARYSVTPFAVRTYAISDFAPGAPVDPGFTVLDPSGTSVAADPVTGDAYVDAGDQIKAYNPAGAELYTFGSGQFGTTSPGVAVKAGGPVYVADDTDHEIDVFGPAPVPSRNYTSSFATFTANNGQNPASVAVDEDTGDVYAVDIDDNTVRRFDSSGAPENFTCTPGPNCADGATNTLTGFAFDPSPGSTQVAIDRSGGPADGTIYVSDGSNALVKVFDVDGTLLGTLDGSGTPNGAFGQPTGVAVDQANGDLFIAGASGARTIWRYSPSAALATEADFTDSIAYSGGIFVNPGHIAVASGNLYAARYSVTPFAVRTYAISDFAPGAPVDPGFTVLDPSGTSVAADPVTGDAYVDAGDQIKAYNPAGAELYTFGSGQFGTTSPGVAVKAGGPVYVADDTDHEIDVFGPAVFGNDLTVTKSGPGTGTVTSDPAGINCGGACLATFDDNTVVTLTAAADPGSRFKSWSDCDSTAGNECTVTLDDTTEVTATFSAAPEIGPATASEVSATAAKLKATVNPNLDATTYHFEYGSAGPCDSNACTSTPNQNAGSGGEAVAVVRPISGLQPATTYHFRVVASNAVDETAGPDGTFTTYAGPTTFDPCSNDGLRTGSGAKLPDCRAYEQATPQDKNGADVSGSLFNVQASTSGDAITSANLSGLPGGNSFYTFPSFMSRRVGDSWSTHGLLPPVSYGEDGRVLAWTPELSYSLSTAYFLNALGTPTLLGQDGAGGSFETVAPYTQGGQYGLAGGSVDGSKILVEATATGALAPGAAAGQPNLYRYDRDTGDLTLAGVLPDGSTPPSGSFAGSYRWFSGTNVNTLDDGAAAFGYFIQEQNAVSDTGDSAYFTASKSGQLYQRQGLNGSSPQTVHVSESEKTNGSGPAGTDPFGPLPAAFQAATPDGSTALFTSAEELTNDANTGPDVEIGDPALGRADLDGSNLDAQLIVPQSASDLDTGAGHIYWADPTTNSIGRADLDGSNLDPDFITGAHGPQGVAVDADGSGGDFLYWTNTATDAIGRAEIDSNGDLVGSPNHEFIAGVAEPEGIDVDATHIYWVYSDPGACGDGSVARADLDGNPGSINPALAPCANGDVEVNATHVYYSLWSGASVGIRRLNLDGSGTSDNITFSLEDDPSKTPHIALDGSHVYWTVNGAGTIGRSDLDGSNATPAFISGLDQPRAITAAPGGLFFSTKPADQGAVAIGRSDLDGANASYDFALGLRATALAADDTHLYWADPSTQSIGRSNLDGSDPDPGFITGVIDPQGIAVSDAHVYWTSAGTHSIGRANLDGSDPQLQFIAGLADPEGIAVNETHVYWINRDAGMLGRAALDGTAVDQGFITDSRIHDSHGLAVNATHIYWTNAPFGSQFSLATIIRRDISGASGTEITRAVGPGVVAPADRGSLSHIALDDDYLYWAVRGTRPDNGEGSIGRIDLDLSAASINRSVVPNVPSAEGVALSGSHLYWSNLPPGGSNPGNDLYRFNADTGELDDLTSDPTEVNGADVKGVLGVSDDGSHVYFVANGVLASGASPGNCAGPTPREVTGECNLYISSDGEISLVARLGAPGQPTDASNWRPTGYADNSGDIVKDSTARVSSNGTLLFRSPQPLTPGAGPNAFYLYHPDDPAPVCIACTPTGGEGQFTLKETDLDHTNAGGASFSAQPFHNRNVSLDGTRVFFETADKLVAADTNGDQSCPVNDRALGRGPACTDVYEWEAVDTEGGTCTDDSTAFNSQSGGCLYLLSTGTSIYPAHLGDASADGDTVFIFTRDRLVPSDRDTLEDIYAVRVGGGLASQHTVPELPCQGDACQGDPNPPPAAPGNGSSTNTGPGNQGKDRTPPPTGSGKTAKKCKKGKKGRKCRKARKRNRSATTNRGGSK